MSCFTSPVTFEIAVRARELGYKGKEMTYGAILDWIAAQNEVLWIEKESVGYRPVCNGTKGARKETWRDAADIGILWVLGEMYK